MQIKQNEPIKVTLNGSPREIGLQHGRLLEPQIKSQISIYEEMFQHTSKMSWEDVRILAEEFRVTVERLTPKLYVEMQGMADGAGLDILDIVALNCRSEIAYGRFSDGCTSLSWKRNGDARVLAQNWDWTALVRENLALVCIEQVGKPTIYMVTEAGIVGKIGFNTAGVGTCLNAIRSRSCTSTKLPIHLALRLCLESSSVDDALKKLASLGGVASSQHVLISDSKTSFGLELSPAGDVHLKEDELGMVFHTNHFIENKTEDENPVEGSHVRLERVQQLCHELVDNGVGEDVSPELLREAVFSDTYNAPHSICCQEDMTRHRTVRSCTLFNIVMNLDLRHLGAEVVVGQPGSGKESLVIKMPWSET